MAGGLYARIKNWIGNENLKNTDLNTEFNNIIQNQNALKSSGYSSTVSQMQETQNPGGVGTEVLPVSMADELKELRYMLDLIIGGAQWYSAPPSNLSILSSGVSSLLVQAANRIVSGRISATNQPMFLVPAGTLPNVTLDCTPTEFSAYVDGVQQTAVADLSIIGLTLAPAVANTALVNDAALAGAQATKTQGERLTQITIDTIGANITALNGQYAAFKKGSEVLLAEVDTTNLRLKNCYRGFFFSPADAWIPRETLSNNDTLTLLKLTWVFYTFSASVSGLDLTYNNPRVSYVQPTSPATGDYWLDLSVNKWKKYTGTIFADANACLIGITAQDTANCIAARSFDFANAFSALNNMELERVDSDNVRTTKLNTQISVYGNAKYYQYDHVRWSMTTDRDTGVTDSASTTYYLYVTDLGGVKISDVAPHQRKFTLLGDYHPANPWRCVGEIANDGASAFLASTLSITEYSQSVLPDSPMVTTQRIADLSVSTGKIIDLAVTQQKRAALGQQVGTSSGAFSTTSAVYVDVASVTITTTGRPVVVGMVWGGAEIDFSGAIAAAAATEIFHAQFLRGATQIFEQVFYLSSPTVGAKQASFSPIWLIDVVALGTITYKMQVKNTSGAHTFNVKNIKLFAYEL